MPYVIVSGNLTPSQNGLTGHAPWKVSISGLKAFELEDLKRFTIDPQADAHTVVFRHHPVVLINALEVLGFRVISSFSASSDLFIWTMRKEFPEPCPDPSDEEEEESSSSSDLE